MQLPLRLRKARLALLLDPMPDAVLRVGHIEWEGEWLIFRLAMSRSGAGRHG